MKKPLALLVGSTLFAAGAFASDTAKPVDLRDRVNCTAIDQLAAIMKKFESVDADKRDVVEGRLSAQLQAHDGGPMPERIFLKSGSQEADFTINEAGELVNFDAVIRNPGGAEICFDDPAREGQPKDQEAFGFAMNFGVFFKETPGQHAVSELKEGAKDGRAFYKKIAPGPAAMLMPKFKHVTVTYEDKSTQPVIYAAKAGNRLDGLTIEPFHDQHVISLDALEKLDADRLVIEGGAYRISPSPSPEKMEKFRGRRN